MDTRPCASSTSYTSVALPFPLSCRVGLSNVNDPSSFGVGVGLGVIGSRPFDVRGGSVKDGGGGDEFMVDQTPYATSIVRVLC
jgi:hypothetical protein